MLRFVAAFRGFCAEGRDSQMQWIGCTDFLSSPSRDGTPHIRQGSPLLRIERKSLESLAALALFTFALLGSELFFGIRMGMPMPLEGAV